MITLRTWILFACFPALVVPFATATELTAITLFGCNEQGAVEEAFRFNSGPIDAAWDIFLYEGPVFDSANGDPRKILWLNDPADHTIRIPLTPGEHTFTFHCDYARRWPLVGMNLFCDGVNDRAVISVKAPMDEEGPPYGAFTENDSRHTMGWPITEVPAAGSLSAGGPDHGIWDFGQVHQNLKVTLKSFRCSTASVDGDLDLVGPHNIGASGKG